MDQVDRLRSEPFAKWAPRRAWQIASITLMALSVALFVAVLVSNLQRPKVSVVLLGGMTAAFCIFSLLLAKVFLQLHRDQRNAAYVLQTAEHEFQQMAGNIQEVFWMIDADSKKALYVNQAYEAVVVQFGFPQASIRIGAVGNCERGIRGALSAIRQFGR
jgi:hypothetical protein